MVEDIDRRLFKQPERFALQPNINIQHPSKAVAVAHIKEQPRISLGGYDRPRMIEKLKEIGLNFGHCRVGRSPPIVCKQTTAGRWIRQNGISVIRARKHKRALGAIKSAKGQAIEQYGEQNEEI